MNKCGFRLNDKRYFFKTAKEAYLNALRVLKKKQPSLYEALRKLVNTENRAYFEKNIDDIYIKSPELADKAGNIAELEPEWHTATNISNREKEKILLCACRVSCVKYLVDFEIWFSGGNNKYTPMSKEEVDLEWKIISDQIDNLLAKS